MQIIKIRTSQNIDIDYEVAGLGDRIIARIVDIGVLVGFSYLLYFFVIIFFLTSIDVNNLKDNGVPVALIIIGIVWSVITVFYDLVAEIFFNGQTVGKHAIKIKVVNINGSRPTVGQFFLRWVFRLVDFILTFGIGAILSVALSEKKQRIGDLVAGTTLIKVKPLTGLKDLVFTAPETDDYKPIFNEVSVMTDADVTLIYEVISNFKATRNSSLVYDMAMQVKKHLGVNIPVEMNEYDFLLAVIKDYNFVTSQAGAF